MRVVLFDGNALGEVARIVRIVPFQHRQVVGQELQWHYIHEWGYERW